MHLVVVTVGSCELVLVISMPEVKVVCQKKCSLARMKSVVGLSRLPGRGMGACAAGGILHC